MTITNTGVSGGANDTDTSLDGEYRAGAGIYLNAQGEWTDPQGNVLTGEALLKAEANASAQYGVGYKEDNLYMQASAEAKMRCEAAIKAEMQSGQHTVDVELDAYAEVYAWAGANANVGKYGCWFEGGAIAGAKAGASAKTYYTNESLIPFAVDTNNSVSVGTQVGAKIGGGYHVPDWNQDNKSITVGGDINLALLVGLKTSGTITVDAEPVYDTIVTPVKDYIVKPIENIIQPIENVIPNLPIPEPKLPKLKKIKKLW